MINMNNFIFIVRRTQHNVAKLELCNQQQSYMFRTHGAIFRLIKYVSYKVSLLSLPTGSRGLQFTSCNNMVCKIVVKI